MAMRHTNPCVLSAVGFESNVTADGMKRKDALDYWRILCTHFNMLKPYKPKRIVMIAPNISVSRKTRLGLSVGG